MKRHTRQLTQTALLLTICIISQFFKNTSVFITGPIINAALLIALFTAGLSSALILSVITPITAFFITGSPIMAAIPLMFPVIMIGNALLVLITWIFTKNQKPKGRAYLGMGVGSVVKAGFMWIMTSYLLFPVFGSQLKAFLPKPEAYTKVLEAAKIKFSLTQLITALIGCLLAVLIMIPLQKFMKNED